MLRPDAHRLALQGQPSEYVFRSSGRAYQVTLVPRLDGRHKIIGVRGTLKELPPGSSGVTSKIGNDVITPQQQRVSAELRSLQTAKAIADTARMGAEMRKLRAIAEEQKAQEAVRRAEAGERRSQFMADVGALLDVSLDLRETLDKVAKLVVVRIGDWCVIRMVQGDKLARFALRHRDKQGTSALRCVFPEEEQNDPLAGLGPLDHVQLLSSLTPNDRAKLASSEPGRRALQELHLESMIQAPIQSHERMIGILTIGSTDPGRFFDLSDLQMVQSLAHRIGVARQSALLYDEAKREIAMRKEAEERLGQLNMELERRVRDRTSLLEEATREANSFAYTVAHDLRAPLRAITGFCQALREDYSAAMDAVGQDYLARIVAGSRRMDDLIRDLLDYARVNRADITRSLVDLDEILDAVLESMSAELQHRKAVVQRTRPLGSVMAHEPMLHQVLTNLLSNGIKFVSRGVEPRVSIWSEPRDGRVRLFFQDNGIGISKEHQDRIFGIFERLNRSEDYPGTGIGLAIVRRAVERLGGSVGLESKPDKGSTFWIELPVA